MKKRVVVSGIGAVSNIGLSVESFWKNALQGKSGVSKITGFSLDRFNFDREMGGEIKDFDFSRYFPKIDPKTLGRASQLAMAAAKECLEDARLGDFDPFSIGVVFGTTMGEAQELASLDDVWKDGFTHPVDSQKCENYFFHKIPQTIAKHFGFNGPNIMIPNACSAGNFALAHALDLLNAGVVEGMLVGGSDPFNRYTFAGFCRVGAVSPDVPRPFSSNREGMIPAEGAGTMFIETLESARAREAPVYAEIVGYGFSNDAYHITQGDPEGISHAYKKALKMSGLRPADISYISVHGTGTKSNDLNEVQALKTVFGDDLKTIPLSSIKSMLGHSMGAASLLEAIVSVLAIRDGRLPPTTNFTEIDPQFDFIDPIPNAAMSKDVVSVFETASGFGGNNCVVILKRV